MAQERLYPLIEVARRLKSNRNLVAYIVTDRQIPVKVLGAAKGLDEAGIELVRAELEAYRDKMLIKV